MNNIRTEFINAVMSSLKIDKNPFIISTVDELTRSIEPTEYKRFLTALFGEQHQYLNGIDRVAKVAEQFKPIQIDETEIKAKHMIRACEAMNTILFDEAQKRGLFFEEYVKDYEFKNISPESKAILNNIKPYCEYKRLIINIRQYQTSKDAIQAFKSAIKQSERGSVGINHKIKKMITN